MDKLTQSIVKSNMRFVFVDCSKAFDTPTKVCSKGGYFHYVLYYFQNFLYFCWKVLKTHESNFAQASKIMYTFKKKL